MLLGLWEEAVSKVKVWHCRGRGTQGLTYGRGERLGITGLSGTFWNAEGIVA